MINNPAIYNFPDRYQNDGLSAFSVTLRYASGASVDLTDCVVRMQLKNMLGQVKYEFSGSDGSIVIGEGGVVTFGAIASWDLASSRYYYDLQVIDSTGFIRTYLKGTWLINPDLTR